jgi:hypothetical protein
MTDATMVPEFQIAKLALEPDDVLVVKGPPPPNGGIMMPPILPRGVRVLYIPPEVDLTILTRAEIEEKAACP